MITMQDLGKLWRARRKRTVWRKVFRIYLGNSPNDNIGDSPRTPAKKQPEMPEEDPPMTPPEKPPCPPRVGVGQLPSDSLRVV